MGTETFIPAQANLLVRLFEREYDEHDNVRVEVTNPNAAMEGVVVQLGSSFLNRKFGSSLPKVRVGDRVLLRTSRLESVTLDGVPYKLAHARDILAIIYTEGN